MTDGISKLARLFKERDNIKHMGIITGKVITTFPDITINILDSQILLTKDHLVFSSFMLSGYNRTYSVVGDNITFSDSDCGTTNSVNDGGDNASSHSHTISNINIETTYTANGTITLTDTLIAGDEVILIPTQDEQIYFVLDKAVRL